ncbi:uncharacterized protein JN550_004592 [Neoarthrinium moseri]|uniref:uncharacterized protein n=1 Tax=Neoarthrinium moseri TaxID=1658444 RepID=UPI001FDAF8AE|nr:uncharacterized protein JN550_004592 [Neoarthrinium moseri]KAI1871598.1 hypothetical protein JN550_004592 [Neoarthrinium moseri]
MGSLDQTTQPLRGINNVAVIGAGISGVTSAAHLLRQGLNVTIFERSSVAGGVWHYDDRVANEPSYPNVQPPTPNFTGSADLRSSKAKTFEEASLTHAPPGPCYKGLKNNVPTTLMRSTLLNWPEGTPEFVSQDRIDKYIQELTIHTGIQEHVLYDTAVDTVRKSPNGTKWDVGTSTLRKTGSDYEFVGRNWEFDAVIVASGHYHEPKIPDLPGLKEWKAKSPQSVMHSKLYRSPELFRDKTILLIGAGVSSLDVARESEGVAKKIYQSARDGQFDLPASLLPPGAERVGGVKKFELDDGAKSGRVTFADGRIVENIDVVVLGTGYVTSYPFLGELQDPSVPTEKADGKIVISSDGLITHNLHKDIFYIPDPTLSFVGVPYYTSTFSLFDFQGEVVARFLAGKVALPSTEAMRREYDERKLGLAEGSKTFHSLMGKDAIYMNGILQWVNRDAVRLGYEPMRGVDEQWLDRYTSFMAEMKKRRETDPPEDQKATLVPDVLRLAVGPASA